MSTGQIILALTPIIVVEVALLVFALRDLARRPRNAVYGGNKWIWLAVIVLVSFGSIVYFLVGRTEPRTTDG